MKKENIAGFAVLILAAVCCLGGVSGTAAMPLECVDFEDLAVGKVYLVGDTFTDSGAIMTVKPFQWSNGQWTSDGYAEVDNAGLAGGSGKDMQVNNVNLGFDFGYNLNELSLLFGEYGGNLNIEINGKFVNFGNFADINGATIGGVNVFVINGHGNDQGSLNLDGTIESFSVGGQELWLDDVCPTGKCFLTLVSSDSVALGDLREFRDGLLTKNETGQKLIQLYYHHSPEVTEILVKKPVLSIRTAGVLNDILPGIHLLLGDGSGEDIVMTSLRVAQIKKLLADIGAQGSDELADTLTELSEMLAKYRGMRVSRIWRSLERQKLGTAPPRPSKHNLTTIWGAIKSNTRDQ